ncbi:MAG: MFS transporter, partial [Woeseiaceae bacterium]
RAVNSFASVLQNLNAVLWTRVSLILMAIMLLDGFIGGYGHALMPIAAIKLFGFTTPQWSQLVAVMGLAGAAAALALGPMIDRFGAKRMLILTISLVAVHAFLLAQTQFLWANTTYVKVMLSAWVLLGPVTMVCMIALAMSVCSSTISATQFAIYMSLANLGSSAGSKTYGLISEQTSYVNAYLLLGAITIAMIGIIVFHRHHPKQVKDRKRAPSYTVGMGTSGGGMYFSGAMRCPKCRSDMELITIDGTEVDRCSSCYGLWFDDGELGKLRNKEAAAVLDIGDIKTGKQQNKIEHYRCPRCAGSMNRLVDPEQTHIWFEQCDACRGLFFDAGELTDLATASVSDFNKRLVTPARNSRDHAWKSAGYGRLDLASAGYGRLDLAFQFAQFCLKLRKCLTRLGQARRLGGRALAVLPISETNRAAFIVGVTAPQPGTKLRLHDAFALRQDLLFQRRQPVVQVHGIGGRPILVTQALGGTRFAVGFRSCRRRIGCGADRCAFRPELCLVLSRRFGRLHAILQRSDFHRQSIVGRDEVEYLLRMIVGHCGHERQCGDCHRQQ